MWNQTRHSRLASPNESFFTISPPGYEESVFITQNPNDTAFQSSPDSSDSDSDEETSAEEHQRQLNHRRRMLGMGISDGNESMEMIELGREEHRRLTRGDRPPPVFPADYVPYEYRIVQDPTNQNPNYPRDSGIWGDSDEEEESKDDPTPPYSPRE